MFSSEDLWIVLFLSLVTLFYGGWSYYTEAEYNWESASESFRRRRIWNLFHAYYDVNVWRENKFVLAETELERTHRLLAVHYDKGVHYSRPPLDKVAAFENPLIMIAHPYGSHAMGLILAFALYGDHHVFKEAKRASLVRVIIDPLYFAIPIVREILLWGGCLAPDLGTIIPLLDKGATLVAAPGGYMESTLAYMNQLNLHYGNEIYMDTLVQTAEKRQIPIVPMVLLGEGENFHGLEFFDRFRQWLWQTFHIRLPGITRFWVSGERLVLVGSPHRAADMKLFNFYSHWLRLLDEGCSAVRLDESYFEAEPTENHNLQNLRKHCGLPRLLRQHIEPPSNVIVQ